MDAQTKEVHSDQTRVAPEWLRVLGGARQWFCPPTVADCAVWDSWRGGQYCQWSFPEWECNNRKRLEGVVFAVPASDARPRSKETKASPP